ncbi:hypothetical protein HK101_008208 [Irineochytrium annulatum]|nr:hypothetical protein HK101_008208 [Irineochytrium annulatum]
MQGLELELFDINFKQWEAKRMLTVTDLRPRYFSTANVELEPSPADPNTFIVTGKSPMTQLPVTLGTIVKMSDIKLQVNPAESESGHSPRSKNAGSLYTLNGSLKDAKFIVIQRFTNSREQRLIGESFGRKLIRKSVRETRWSCEMDLEEDDEASIGAGVTECGQLLMSAIIFVHVLFNAN